MLPLAFGFGGPQDIMIIAVVVMVLFGGAKLAGFGKSLGEGIKEFKKATRDEDEQTASPTPVSSAAQTTPTPTPTTTSGDKS
jgi:sec-independent protein translocase protein TatA